MLGTENLCKITKTVRHVGKLGTSNEKWPYARKLLTDLDCMYNLYAQAVYTNAKY